MNTIKGALQTLNAIEGTTSTTEKINLLKANKDNEYLKELLAFTYNNFITYGIKKEPDVEPKGTEITIDKHHEFLSLLMILSDRKLTGNKAIEEVANFFESLHPEQYKWYLRVLQRDLKAGITEKTANKVWKGLIPSFTCALANPYNEKKIPKRFVADPKLDGYRCLAFNYGGAKGVELRSRNGHLLSGYVGIEKDIADYLPTGFVYDGEILGREMTFNGVQKSAFKKADNKDGVLHIFDVVSIEEFSTDNFQVSYEGRIGFLDQVTDIITQCRSLDRVTPSRVLTNTQEDIATLIELHTLYTKMGYEGTMIKDVDALYKKDKSYNIMKLKDFYDIDLVVTGVYEGTGKFAGTMGGVTVMLSDEDIKLQTPWEDKKHAKKLQFIEGGTFEVKVGSGFNDVERKQFWNNPNLIIGKTIEIQFQETSLNDKGEHSLRFPTLVKIRDDK